MIYLDSSVVFSVHGRDVHTVAAVALLRSANEPLALTQLCEVEFVNALCLRQFRREISQTQVQASIADLEQNIRRGVYRLLSIPDSAFTRAKILAQTLTLAIGVRAADLLHVSAAMELGASCLFTFDQKQHRTAQAAGLAVNPLS
ncbi:MAG: type II toxin-antitoxin system VapC family toxin [Terracidiphilus sp.]|jgi:predicted nucleic acid-binding protein